MPKRRAAHPALCTALVGVLLFAGARGGASQPPSQNGRGYVAVTVVVVEGTGAEDTTVRIVRRTGTKPRDLILLPRRAATGERLAGAIASLLIAHQELGAHPTLPGVIEVHGSTVPTRWNATELPRAQRVVQRLLRSRFRWVDGVGSVQAVDIIVRRVRVIPARPTVRHDPA